MKSNINVKYRKRSRSASMPSKQNGIALLGIVLVLMVVVGLLSMTSAKNTILETKMVFNLQDKQRSLTAADSAAQYGWEQIQKNSDVTKLINNDTEAGYYVLGDKIELESGTKSGDDWDANENVMTWPWHDIKKRFEIPALGGTANPMKLVATPQYTVGIHNAVVRKGTSSHFCTPMSIIGASQGGTTQTRTLIELNVIPNGLCYHDPVK